MARDEAPAPAGPATPQAWRRIAELDAAAGRLGAELGDRLADPALAWLPVALRRTAQAERLRASQAAAEFHAALATRSGALSVRRRRLLARCDAYAQRVAALERRSTQLGALARLDAAGVAAAVVAFMQQLHGALAEPAGRAERCLIELDRELARVRRRGASDGYAAAIDDLRSAAAPLLPQVGRLGRLLAGASGVGAATVVDEAFAGRGAASPATLQHRLHEIAANQAGLNAAARAFAAAGPLGAPASAGHDAKGAASIEQRRGEAQALLERIQAALTPLAQHAPVLQRALAELQRRVAALRPRGVAVSDGSLRALLAAATEGAAAPRYRISPGPRSSSSFAPFGS